MLRGALALDSVGADAQLGVDHLVGMGDQLRRELLSGGGEGQAAVSRGVQAVVAPQAGRARHVGHYVPHQLRAASHSPQKHCAYRLEGMQEGGCWQ